MKFYLVKWQTRSTCAKHIIIYIRLRQLNGKKLSKSLYVGDKKFQDLKTSIDKKLLRDRGASINSQFIFLQPAVCLICVYCPNGLDYHKIWELPNGEMISQSQILPKVVYKSKFCEPQGRIHMDIHISKLIDFRFII